MTGVGRVLVGEEREQGGGVEAAAQDEGVAVPESAGVWIGLFADEAQDAERF
jgi:hypothetical protein